MATFWIEEHVTTLYKIRKGFMDWSKYFYYDETSPSGLRCKVEVRSGNNGNVISKHVGDISGGLDHRKRWLVSFQGGTYRCHRIIYELFFGKIPEGYVIDHIDGDSSNNKISNLRLVDRFLNARNQKKNSRNTTGFVGVSEVEVGSNSHGYRATWRDLLGGRHTKLFTIRDFGDRALQAAIEHRIAKIEELNSQGAGYTDRHIYGR